MPSSVQGAGPVARRHPRHASGHRKPAGRPGQSGQIDFFHLPAQRWITHHMQRVGSLFGKECVTLIYLLHLTMMIEIVYMGNVLEWLNVNCEL